jgi:hypothetical protein
MELWDHLTGTGGYQCGDWWVKLSMLSLSYIIMIRKIRYQEIAAMLYPFNTWTISSI